MYTQTNPWILRFQPRPQATCRLFCFSYAGGGASLFRTWSSALPGHIEMCALQLPGREGRIQEKPFTQLQPLLQTLAKELQPYLSQLPFAFFGHSMGSLIAFELTRYLRIHTGLSPDHLFVSSRQAPQLPLPPFIHNMTDAALISYLQQRYNGISQAILDESELLKLFLPTIRADMTLLETAAYISSEPLNCPITAFGGLQDPSYSQAKLQAWQEQTSGAFTMHVFPGDHFYLRHVQTQLLAIITEEWLGKAGNISR